MKDLVQSKFWLIAFLCLSSLTYSAVAQEDDLGEFDDFDPSMFEEVGATTKAFCTNKVFGQQPTPLISVGFDYQGASNIASNAFSDYASEDSEVGFNSGFRLTTNIPVLSRNNILINWGLNYVQMGYSFSNDNLVNPFHGTLRNHSLKWLNTNLTVFKPLNETRFLLLQAGGELNGDYSFNNMPSFGQLRLPAAAIYGFKPTDNLMWGIGISNTYLGGSRNLLPIIYYYQTFDNPRWGIEALFPARVQARYRWDSRSLLMMGYQVEGATYRLSNFNEYDFNAATGGASRFEDVELRRSEIRLGLSYNRGINDFIWIGLQAGYRINYQFNLDEGEFYRGFDDSNYLLQNELSNTLYAQFTISLVSP